MANTPPQLRASGAIRPCRIVKSSGNLTGAEADANEKGIGISYQDTRDPPLSGFSPSTNHASTGDPIRLYTQGDICLLQLGGTVTAGDELKSDADGQGVVIASSGTTLQQVCAIALEGGSSGEKRLVQVARYVVAHPA